MTRKIRASLAPCLVVFLASAAPVLGHEGHHVHAGHAMAGASPAYARSVAEYRVPDTVLLDANGATVALRKELERDGPVMLNFIFTSCTAICPVMSATFAQVQGRFDADDPAARLISISIDPEQDTPERLRDYARRFEAGPRWSFFTGSAEASIAVQRAFGVYRGDKMSHDPVTFVRAARGDPWVRLDGFVGAADLMREYRRLAAH